MTTHANRGMNLEKAIEASCTKYRIRGTACINKINPKVIQKNIGRQTHLVRLRSTVDFDGVCCGVPVAFDAKETKLPRLPLANVHEHQVQYLDDFTRCRGLGFLLVMFAEASEVYAITPEWFKSRLKETGKKSIPLMAFQELSTAEWSACVKIKIGGSGVPIDFAPAVRTLWQRARMMEKSA